MSGEGIGSDGDRTGGFRITSTDPQAFSPPSRAPAGSPAPAAGEGNGLGPEQGEAHTGVNRDAPSIFVQHGSGAGSAMGQNLNSGAEVQTGDGDVNPNGQAKRGRTAGESSRPPPQYDERSFSPGDRKRNYRESSNGPEYASRAGAGANNIPVGVDSGVWSSFLEFQKYQQGNATRNEVRKVVLDEKYFRRIKPFEGDAKVSLRTWLFDFLVAIGQLDDTLAVELKKLCRRGGLIGRKMGPHNGHATGSTGV